MAGLDPKELSQVIATLQRYADKELTVARLLDLDHNDEFPQDVLDELYQNIGLHLLFIPEELGGMGGGAMDIYRVSEVMAAIDLGIATGVLATFLGTDPITVGGTPEQQERWMGRIADEGLLVAYGATEPQAGSDLASLKTRAVPVEEDGAVVGYRITGRKQWISNGGVATLYTILALAPGGPTWFVVERGAEGFSQGKPEDKHGIRLSNTAALFLEDVYVPAEDYIPKAIALCKERNVLFIADEIQTGIARTGRLLASCHNSGCSCAKGLCEDPDPAKRPDAVLLAKALSGGMYPVSAVLANEEVMEVFTPGTHGSTYGGNPMGAHIAMESLAIVTDEDLCGNAERLGQLFRAEMQKLVEDYPWVKKVRGRGLLNALLIEPRKAADGSPKTAWELCLLLRDNGLLAKPTHGDIIRFAPPLVITEEQLMECVNIIRTSVGQFA